jgi:uncharacterized ubiquitin-like protein YukD
MIDVNKFISIMIKDQRRYTQYYDLFYSEDISFQKQVRKIILTKWEARKLERKLSKKDCKLENWIMKI